MRPVRPPNNRIRHPRCNSNHSRWDSSHQSISLMQPINPTKLNIQPPLPSLQQIQQDIELRVRIQRPLRIKASIVLNNDLAPLHHRIRKEPVSKSQPRRERTHGGSIPACPRRNLSQPLESALDVTCGVINRCTSRYANDPVEAECSHSSGMQVLQFLVIVTVKIIIVVADLNLSPELPIWVCSSRRSRWCRMASGPSSTDAWTTRKFVAGELLISWSRDASSGV